MHRIAVLSPSRFSLYTICVAELLRRQHVHIEAIYVRRLASGRRVFSELRRDGSRLLTKLWKKLVLRDRAYTARDYETIVSFMQREKIAFRRVDAFQVEHGIPVVYCDDLNDEVVVDGLRKAMPEMVVFTGGGLLRREVLSNAGAGVLNCHMGVLPAYRGMDVVEWPILEGRFDEIGMTAHFMDDGVDTGDILRVTKMEIRPGETIGQLRERFEPVMCREIVRACTEFLGGVLLRHPQRGEREKQYFVMCPRLIRLASRRLDQFHQTGKN